MVTCSAICIVNTLLHALENDFLFCALCPSGYWVTYKILCCDAPTLMMTRSIGHCFLLVKLAFGVRQLLCIIFFPIHKVLATWHYCSMISFCANRFKILIVLYNLVSSYLQLVIVWTRFLIWTPFWHQLLLPVLFCQMTTSIAIEDVRREVKILKALAGNKNLVQFYDAYEDNENVYIVME